MLVPTTVLAFQHYQTFCERLKDFPCKIDYISRARTAAKSRLPLKELKEGEVNILIGTHRIVGKDVRFKDLGLLIIDEEQKFGGIRQGEASAAEGERGHLDHDGHPDPPYPTVLLDGGPGSFQHHHATAQPLSRADGGGAFQPRYHPRSHQFRDEP